ncbi:MAG: hypothetical protein LBB83_01535, partial [Treponema sp.]|nr:hypothetical protein [Treponema sp.]
MDLYSSQEIQQNYARRSAEREANRDRYMTELTDTDFRLLNETYGEESDDEEYANRRYRAAAAFKLARMYNLPPPEAETYLDDFIKAEFPRADSPKTAWKAVADSFALGANQKRLAALGLRLMTLPEGEARNTLWQEIEAIGKENMELKDEVQRGWVLEGLKGFGTSWAFTASAAGAGFLGSLGTPALGIASAAAVSAADMTGLEFVNLLSEGVDWETARNTAIASGTIQGVLEAFIGDIPALGSRTGLGQLIFRKLHYAGKFGAAARVLGARAIDSVMEGVEELAQEKVSQIGTERAKQATEQKVQGLIAQGKPWDEAAADLATAAFEEYYRATSESGDHGNKLRRDTPEELDRALRESFRVGFLTSLVTGVPIIGRDIHASMTDLKKLKAAADTAPTFDAYKKLTEKNPALQAFNETNKTAIQEQLFSSAQERRKQEEAAIAEELRKSRLYGGADSSEGAAYRGEDGAPYVERQEHTGSDGITTGEFAMGNPQMTENNTYARAPYTVSGERIVIERVRMAESREALRPEFLQVIANSVNQEVVWEGETYTPQADGARAARIGMERQARQTAAPAERFTATERRIFERLKKVMPEIRNDAEGKAIAEQVKFHAALNNLTAEQYIEKRFEPGITTETDANTLAAAQKVSGRQKGATTFNPETGKALIAGSTWADFSTASHEFAHVLRRQLQGDLLAEAERVYGVTDGNWTGDQEEAFARGYEKYLEAGEAPTPKLADLFRKLKDFMGRIYAIVKNEHILTDGQKALFDRIFREAQTNLEAMENAGTQPGAAGNIREGGGPRHTEELGLFQADMTPEDRVINDETAGFTERARAVVNKAGKAYAWEMLAEEDKAHLATGGLLVRAMKIRGPAAREAVMEAIRALRKRYAGTEAEYKAPNGKPSLLIEALGEERGRQAWYAVRTPSFKDWFGDWERAARIAQLEKSPNLKLDGNAYEGKYDISGTPKENHKSITAYLKSIAKNEKLGNSYVSEPIRLGNDGIDKMTSYGMSNLAYMKSIAHIPTLLKNAVLITEESPRKSVAHYYAYKHLATGFEMNGEKYTAHIVLGENAGIWYYQHNLSQIEKGTLVEVIRGTNSGLQDSLLDTVKDTTLIGILQAPDTSKVIDANGEPLAVFHGTGTAFDVFSNESGLEAYYFTAEKHRADTYAKMKGDQGGIVMPVFLNVKKPVELDAEEFKKDNIENYSVEYDGAINRWAHAYAVFSPTQIKSATDNAGTFSNENPSILFQTIGERGAAALDRAEEATTRLDNLAIARQMEAAGKDAKAVRLATGWERGADGKWRYEIGDGFHFDLSQLNMAGSFEGRLDAILSHDELFAAYPKLRDTKLTVNSQEQLKQFFGVPYAGAYSEEENWIRINYQTLERGRIENTDSIFIHEIQHAIQSMEGFSYGSNTVHFDTLFSDTEDITDFLELDKEYRQYREKKKLAEWLVMPENFRRIKSPAIKNIVNQFRNGELGKFEAGDKLWEFHQQHYENIRKKRDAYERTAGEVEARNVQARMGFTPQQRLETLLEETEDVRREDQLFLAEGARTGAAMAMGEERRTAAVVDIDPEIIVDESGKPIDLKNTRELVTWIRKQYQGKEVTISDGGLHLTLTRWGLESSAKKRGEKHHQAYAGLERLIETALYDSYEEGDKVHPNVEKQNIYYAAVRINDALYSVRLKIDIPTDKSNPNYYKDHKITEIEIAPSLYQGSSVTGPSLQDESAITEISLAVLKGEVNASRIEGAALFQGALLEAYYAEHPGTRERVERFLAMAESDEGLLGMAR